MSFNFSILEFGSKSRGTSDEYSDNDLLVVVENKKEFDYSIVNKYTLNPEYSISYYNYEKLEFLSRTGSLFVQHLKQEGRIIEDKTGRLLKILNEYLPNESYIKDLESSRTFFNFISCIPDLALGKGWFCDCLYVGLRNFLVLLFANKKKYIFSYIDLLKEILSQKIITQEEFDLLTRLRIIKQNYRSRKLDDIDQVYLRKIQVVYAKIGLKIDITLKPLNEAKLEMINKVRDSTYNPYQKLRIFECAYICSNKKNIFIENIIKNPQFYTQKFKNEKVIAQYLYLLQ